MALARLSLLFLFFFAVVSSLCAQSRQTIQNIEAFTKLYGYVRFFHPSDEASAIDWDKFAVYGCERIEKARSPQELQFILTELFTPIAPTLKLSTNPDKASFQLQAITPADTSAYQLISWQHLGVFLGNTRNIYQSVRTNRANANKATQADFGNLSTFIDATPYRNKEFRFTAQVNNTENKGPGFLWARVDRPNRQMGFFDNMRNRPIQASEWRQYQVTGKIDQDALSLHFGSFLQGEGGLLLDDVKLFIKEDTGWKQVYSADFETEKLGDAPTSLHGGQSGQGYQYAISAQGAGEGKQSVAIQKKAAGIKASELFKEKVSIGEYIQEDLGSGISCLLPLALYGKETFTYPQADKAALASLQKDLEKVSAKEFTGSNLYVRLAGIVISWNIFEHFYPYFEVVKTDWNAHLSKAIGQTYTDKREEDFLLTLRRFTAPLQDGHIRVSSQADTKTYYPAIEWEWVEKELLITRVMGDSLPVRVGDMVTSIDGKDPRKYFQEEETYISAATKGWLQARSKVSTLAGNNHSKMKLTVKNEQGHTKNCTLSRNIDIRNYYQVLPKGDTARQISPTLFYLNLDKLSMESINQLIPQLEKAQSIICDLRGYPKGNHALIAHLLTEKDTSERWMHIPKIIYPHRKKLAGFQSSGWQIEPMQPHLKAKMIFITDGSAISYAESYMGFIEGYKLATIVGQPTAGTNGNINPFPLPGGYYISWTGMKVVKHNGKPHHGVGIIPNIYVEKTIKGIREGKDEFLEKAIEVAHGR